MDSKLLSTGSSYSNLPENYIRPESERPRLSEVMDCENVPVIDLGCADKSLVIQQIGDACRSYGFFQVINHDIPNELTDGMLSVAHEFFHLPLEVKMKFYSDDPSKTMRLSTSFNVKKETIHNWRDYLRLHCHPLEKFVQEWPSVPSSFRDVVSTYCKEVRQLGFRLLGYVSQSLGLEEDYMKLRLGDQGQHMAVNYYPPCPEPDLTYGLPGHTDPNTITILLQGQDVAGLQVLKDGKWLAVNPHPKAFVINIGDQIQVSVTIVWFESPNIQSKRSFASFYGDRGTLKVKRLQNETIWKNFWDLKCTPSRNNSCRQALSNGKYQSVWHRAVVNSGKERISVASFLCPANNAVIAPATIEGSQAVYKNFTYEEYYKKFWSRNLDQEHCLELFKN